MTESAESLVAWPVRLHRLWRRWAEVEQMKLDRWAANRATPTPVVVLEPLSPTE